MKIGIMQPYFFPYIGYFSLIKHTDLFILFDTVQFIRHGWIERNRILKPNTSWQYISVPLMSHSRETLIKDIIINNNIDWKNKIFRQLLHYKKYSLYYEDVIKLMEECLDTKTDSIVELNNSVVLGICKYLGITKEIHVFSRMNMNIEKANAPDEWALNICKRIGNVKQYWNPIGGIDFFDREKYEKNGISLFFQKINIFPYKQKLENSCFEPGLSIIDVMMFNSPEKIYEMLDDYELI